MNKEKNKEKKILRLDLVSVERSLTSVETKLGKDR